jgi:hypothetical protein
MSNAPGLTWPSLLVTVYEMAGTGPVKPGAGVKVAVPPGSTTTVPATLPLMGSVTVTGVGPGVYTTLEPGRVKPVTLTVVPGGGTVLSSRLRVSGPLPAGRVWVSLASVSTGLTVMVNGTSTDWPSELDTSTSTVGTGPVNPGAGVKT